MKFLKFMKKSILPFLSAICISFFVFYAPNTSVIDAYAEEIQAEESIVEEYEESSIEDEGNVENSADDEGNVENSADNDEKVDNSGTYVPSEGDEDTDSFTQILISYLEKKYGEEYHRYYDAILQEWGSAKAYVENVLLNAVNEGIISEEKASGFQSFINWLHKYTVIWVPVLSAVLLAIALRFGKNSIAKIKEFFNKIFNKVFKGNNQNASALLVVLDSMEVLLGNSGKTEEQRKKIEEVKKELEKDV